MGRTDTAKIVDRLKSKGVFERMDEVVTIDERLIDACLDYARVAEASYYKDDEPGRHLIMRSIRSRMYDYIREIDKGRI